VHPYASVDTHKFYVALPISKLAKKDILASRLVCDSQKLKHMLYLRSARRYTSVDTHNLSVALLVPKLAKMGSDFKVVFARLCTLTVHQASGNTCRAFPTILNYASLLIWMHFQNEI